MLGVILLYVMIQMWLYDSDKKDRKKMKRKTVLKRYNDGWEVYSKTKASQGQPTDRHGSGLRVAGGPFAGRTLNTDNLSRQGAGFSRSFSFL